MKAIKLNDISKLKADLPVVFIGFPNFSSDDKVVGGRELIININDRRASAFSKRVSRQYQAGRLIIDIIKDLSVLAGIKIDVKALEDDEDFKKLKTVNALYFWNRPILTDLFFSLSTSYGFYFFVDGRSGNVIFTPANTRGIVGGFTVINEKEGMVEHPVSVNFINWKVKTFFGRPKVLYPRDWIRIESNFMARLNKRTQGREIRGIVKPVDNTVTGLIIGADYNWGGAEAIIEYTISTTGTAFNSSPIRPI